MKTRNLKLLDPKRDSDKRLSNLRHIIDNAQEIADQQLLFCQFYSHIYFVFYENFLLVEQKLKAGHRNGWFSYFWIVSFFTESELDSWHSLTIRVFLLTNEVTKKSPDQVQNEPPRN